MTTLSHPDWLRVMDVLDATPWRKDDATRAELWHALECAAALPPSDPERCASWERVRYLAGYPVGGGAHRPLYALGAGPTAEDPYTVGEPPGFGELLAMLNYAAGWAAA